MFAMRGATFCGIVAFAGVASAAPSALDKPAFTAAPAELLAVAKAAPSTSDDVVLLRQDHDVSYDDRGRQTAVWRFVFVVATKHGIDDWDVLSSTWLPAYQNKPTVRARVIDASGRVTDLDPSQVTDRSSQDGAPATDRRTLEVKLPRLSVGAIVEEEVTTVDREPLLGGGALYSAYIGNSLPLASVRVTFTSPKKLRILAHGLPAGVKPKTETVGGKQRVTYTIDRLPSVDDADSFLPADARPYPTILATPVASWNAIAREYRALIDKRIAEGPVALPAGVDKTASLETVRALVVWLGRQVEYQGGDIDDTAIVPSTPAETLKRGTADSKDMATLLLALLRQAGIRANLVLIDAGPGSDFDRDLPAFNQFEHVLVRAQIGKTQLWIDPVATLTEPGRLPSWDEGRLALVVADDTNALVTTPASAMRDNLVREVRTFALAEENAGSVTEVSREGGVFDADQRQWIAETAPDAVRKNFGEYVDREYGGARLASYSTSQADELAKPFEITVVATDASRAYTHRNTIDVYLPRTDALKKLPELLRAPPEHAKPRKFDFQLPTPHVYEIENRLVVPPGYTMPSPAPDQTRDLGAFKLAVRQRVDGATFVVTVRFETPKPRLTPAEMMATQQAIRALRQEDVLHIVIPHTALALADKGTYRDAIAEVTKLIKLHPKEALHHQQLAHVLILAGAGEAARREARKAVELEPKRADALVVLAWVLQHDTFGRWLGFDHDWAGARAALEKARKLDPKHVGAATDLAELLERDAKGRRFEAGVDLRAAIEAWRAARALEDTTDTAYSLATALLWVGEAGEAEKVLRSLPAAERRDELLIAAAAIANGPDAALRTASSLASGQTRTKYVGAAGATLFLMRRYDAMRPLYADAKVAQGGVERMLQQITRSDKPFKPGKDPLDAVIEMTLVTLQPGRSGNPFWDKQTRDEALAAANSMKATFRHTELMTDALLEDLTRSALQATIDGDAGLWRIEIQPGASKAHVYVASDRGTPKVIADAESPEGAGRHVLRLLAKNDEKSALRLLDWLANDLRIHRSFLTPRFMTVWGDNLPRARKDMELAAAVLIGTSDAAHAAPILEHCRPATTNGQFTCDWVLAEIYKAGGRWGDLLDHVHAWKTRTSISSVFVPMNEAYALAHLGNFDDADHVIEDALAKDPGDLALAFVYSDLAVGRGQLAEAVRRLDTVTKAGSPDVSSLNNLAWLELFEGSDIKGAILIARRALQMAPNKANVANTAAALEAEAGELSEAKHHLDVSVDVREKPGGADLFVHARMLEQLGSVDDAIAIYRRIKPGSTDFTFTPDESVLAERRLKALGVKK